VLESQLPLGQTASTETGKAATTLLLFSIPNHSPTSVAFTLIQILFLLFIFFISVAAKQLNIK
jgi:hypothetical protein